MTWILEVFLVGDANDAFQDVVMAIQLYKSGLNDTSRCAPPTSSSYFSTQCLALMISTISLESSWADQSTVEHNEIAHRRADYFRMSSSIFQISLIC